MDSDVREKYTHGFSGVNFYKLKLHDESVKPVVQHIAEFSSVRARRWMQSWMNVWSSAL